MFNEIIFNTLPLNQVVSEYETLDSNFYIKYNNFLLHDNVNIFSSIEYLDPKVISNDKTFISNNNGIIYNIKEGLKTINVSGIIKQNSRSDLLDYIYYMKSKLLDQNQYLIINDSGNLKRLKVVSSTINFSENHYNICWMEFSIQFVTYDYIENEESMSEFFNTTDSSYQFNISNDGTAESCIQLNLIFNSTASTDSVVIDIGGQELTISETINSGDVLLLDGYNSQIKLNGDLINFDGEIQYLQPGNNIVTITTNGTVDLDILYKTNYRFK